MCTSNSEDKIETLQLGYRIRRASLQTCGGLSVFPHDLRTFCIPPDKATQLAETYKRYLIAIGILNPELHHDHPSDSMFDDEAIACDRQTLCFIHESNGIDFVEGEFCLEAAIEFLLQETKLTKSLSIRWCMMMEYVSYEDQRTEERRKSKKIEQKGD